MNKERQEKIEPLLGAAAMIARGRANRTRLTPKKIQGGKNV